MRLSDAGLIAGLLLVTSAAQANVAPTATAGFWSAFEGVADGGIPVCGVGTHDNLGRMLLFKYFDKAPAITVQVTKEGWQIPSGTTVPVEMIIGNNPTWTANATGDGAFVAFSIFTQTLDEFQREFRRAAFIRIRFAQGSEPEMIESLAGSSAVDTEMTNCMRRLVQSHQVTQPFGAPTGATSQPFTPTPAPSPAAPIPPRPTAPSEALTTSQNL